MKHLDNLEHILGGLNGKKILDVGAGAGNFLIPCAERGYDAVGVELSTEKIARAEVEAAKRGVAIKIVQGAAERLPFADASFDFANVGEVIEHVRDPKQVLSEIHRVLKPGGKAYMSVHNRFGMYDTHFHVYFLGWLPRSWANGYLSLLGKHKDYALAVDMQNINEMHYYSYGRFCRLAQAAGFAVADLREMKVRRRFGSFAVFPYHLLRAAYFSTFHTLLSKHDRRF